MQWQRNLLVGVAVSVFVFVQQSYSQETTPMKKPNSNEATQSTAVAGPKLKVQMPSSDRWVETTRTPTKRVPIDTEKWGALYIPTYAVKTVGKPKTEKIHRFERTNASRTRVSACTDSTAKAFINGKEAKVYPDGAFAGMADLVIGENKVEIACEDATGKTVQTFLVERMPPMKSSPEQPLTIESTALISPNEDMVLQPGDEVSVRCKGSPGCNVSFSIGMSTSRSNIPMRELDVATTGMFANVGGIYAGSYIIQPNDRFTDASIRFKLSKSYDGKINTITQTAPGKISIDTNSIPTVARLTTSYKTVYDDADGYVKLFALNADGIKLHLVGRKGDMIKVQLSPTEVGWIDPDDVEILPAGTPIPSATVGSISFSTVGRWSRIYVGTSDRLPYKVDQYLSPSVLELTIYGAVSRLSWITENMNDPIIKNLQWKQAGEKTLKLRVELKNEQQWGWDVHYEGNALVWDIKQPPQIAAPPASPVSGLKFVLDPGHGGKEFGAVGPAGVKEKDVNLEYATDLAELLRAAGATVVLTHGELAADSSMRIQDRMDVAIKEQADIYLVLHNNSVGNSDPIAIRGTSAYYHHPQAQALGHSIYRRLLDELGVPGFGFVYFDLAAVRTHQSITDLVEGSFMSNPEEEYLLSTPDYRKKLATAIFHGVEDFLEKQR